MTRLLAAVAATLLLTAGCAQSTSEPPPAQGAVLPSATTEQLTKDLTLALEKYRVPGGVVEVCSPGYDTWATAAGVADVDAGTPMTTDLVWPLRSVTKSFTVTSILQLADEGRLVLSDPISDYVAGVPNGDDITLGQLTAMTAGVPEYTTQAWIKDYLRDETRAFTTAELIDYANAEPAQFPPGTRAVYTNTSTLLLGEVVSSVTGLPFDQALQEMILDPLGLTDTRYPIAADDWSGPHPTGYQPGESGDLEAQGNNFTVFGPAGAMTSTLDDLCTWGTALGSGELLQPATQRERLKGQPLDKGPEYDEYGQGIGSLEGWGGHTGEGFGHTLAVMHNETTGTTAVVAMNASGLKHHVPTRLFRTMASTLDAIPPVE